MQGNVAMTGYQQKIEESVEQGLDTLLEGSDLLGKQIHDLTDCLNYFLAPTLPVVAGTQGVRMAVAQDSSPACQRIREISDRLSAAQSMINDLKTRIR